MFNIFNRIRKRFQKQVTYDPEELRWIFQNRYHNFKLLLGANNRALENMTEIEEMLEGHQPFGMTFIRSRLTRLSKDVFQMIQNLNVLGSGRYEKLFSSFYKIQENITRIVDTDVSTRGEPFVLPLETISKNDSDLVGPKMANLGEIKNILNLRVPDGFSITSEAYRRFMIHNDLLAEINRISQKTVTEDLDDFFSLSASIQNLILNSSIPADLEDAIGKQVEVLIKKHGSNITFALRSSAVGEDLSTHSFAGQYRSLLNVDPENIFHAYKEVVASKYSLTAISYRFRYGIRDEDVPMCVGCLIMISPISSGVVYTRNPVNVRDDTMLIHSIWGLPKPVVDGSLSPDIFVISRKAPGQVMYANLAIKDVAYVSLPEEGIARVEVPPHQWDIPSLTEDQLKRLSRIALAIEQHYGFPQDIEWALLPEDAFVILQARGLRMGENMEITKNMETSTDEDIIIQGGVKASPGVGGGEVFILRRDADILRFPKGAVLVTELALPRWASLLSRASAVITEVGNIAGHLANVAREFGVPAIFGLSGVTDKLKDGQHVTVDADRRVVLKGLLKDGFGKKEKPLMLNTPLYRLLHDVSRLVVPLNLTDPDSLDFKPDSCKTYHDITRFCHEMAVREMFSFGKEFAFPEKSAKQLVHGAKMQFWVLDLDDGFLSGTSITDSKYVTIDDITSIPMKSIWAGMVAVPWSGPPPLETRGFFSVLAESTFNPQLDPAVYSSFQVKNYFMISKHFCSLQSRFGYHFSTVEALVSERTRENYAAFNFKGGAANLERRVRRANFIAGLLEEWNFRSHLYGDALNARIEGRTVEEMEEALKILGYVIIHTRQLDMIMSDPASVSYYREKMISDLRALCARGR